MLKKTLISLSLLGGISFTTILFNHHQLVNSQTISNPNPSPEYLAGIRKHQLDNIAQTPPEIAENPTSTISMPKKNYTGIVKKIDTIAQKITVRIDSINNNAQKSNSSGVILAKRGDTYYVATARYVFCPRDLRDGCAEKGQNQIVTPDGISHQVNYQTIEFIPQTEIVIIQFQSKNNYSVATVANYQWQNQWVFTSGFAVNQNQPVTRILTAGKVFIKEKAPFVVKDAYSLAGISQPLVYTNISYPGMGGGAVLDSEGRLIGINIGIEAELYFDDEGNYDMYNIGYSLGDSIQGLLSSLKDNNISLKSQGLTIETNLPNKLTANEIAIIQEQLQIIKKPTQLTNITDWMNYGNQLWREGKYTEAKTSLQQAIALEPNFDKAHYALGLVAFDMKNYQEAVNAFNKATEINNNPYYYWHKLGTSYAKLGKYDLALSAYNQAIKQNKGNKDFVLYLARGDVYQELENYQLAIADYSQAIKINPESTDVYKNRANTYYKQGKYELAIADYTQAINIHPQDAETYLYRGLSYYKQGRYELAIADYTKAIEINPNFAEAYLNRGNTYNEQEKYELAITDFIKANEINPNNAEAYYCRGIVYRELGKYELALADFHKAIEINPLYGEAYYERGITYRELGKYELALADFSKVLESASPNFYRVYLGRGLTYIDLQEYNLAIADFTKIIEINTEFAEAYLYRGVAYSILGKKNEAIEDIEKAIDLFKQQNKVEEHQKAIALLKQLQR